jgi:hypothetical protein
MMRNNNDVTRYLFDKYFNNLTLKEMLKLNNFFSFSLTTYALYAQWLGPLGVVQPPLDSTSGGVQPILIALWSVEL